MRERCICPRTLKLGTRYEEKIVVKFTTRPLDTALRPLSSVCLFVRSIVCPSAYYVSSFPVFLSESLC